MGQKLGGGCAVFFWGSRVAIEHKVAWAEAYLHAILVHPAVWSQRTLAENWGLCPFRGGELGPYLTMLHRLNSTSVTISGK